VIPFPYRRYPFPSDPSLPPFVLLPLCEEYSRIWNSPPHLTFTTSTSAIISMPRFQPVIQYSLSFHTESHLIQPTNTHERWRGNAERWQSPERGSDSKFGIACRYEGEIVGIRALTRECMKSLKEGCSQRKMRVAKFERSGAWQRTRCGQSERQWGVRWVIPGVERYGAEDRANARSSHRSIHETLDDRANGEMEGHKRHANPVGRFGITRDAKFGEWHSK